MKLIFWQDLGVWHRAGKHVGINYRRKKTQPCVWVFLNLVGERGLFPCGPLLKQRCLAALGSNLLRRFSSSSNYRCKKTNPKVGLF